MEIKPSGIEMLVRLKQAENAQKPIEVTPAGRATLIMPQWLNASLPISVTGKF